MMYIDGWYDKFIEYLDSSDMEPETFQACARAVLKTDLTERQPNIRRFVINFVEAFSDKPNDFKQQQLRWMFDKLSNFIRKFVVSYQKGGELYGRN